MVSELSVYPILHSVFLNRGRARVSVLVCVFQGFLTDFAISVFVCLGSACRTGHGSVEFSDSWLSVRGGGNPSCVFESVFSVCESPVDFSGSLKSTAQHILFSELFFNNFSEEF